MDAILLTCCPALLGSRGPGHEPPYVIDVDPTQNLWMAPEDLADPEYYEFFKHAAPLWWNGSPVWPAIDAAVRLANGAWNERDGRYLLHPRPYNTTRENILALSEDIAEILGATMINLETEK